MATEQGSRSTQPAIKDPSVMVRALENLVPGAKVTAGESELRLHSEDLSFHPSSNPHAVVYARTTEDVSEVLRWAHTNHVPVVPFGVGSSLDGHVVPVQGGISLDLSRMDEIVAIRSEELSATVQAGVRRLPLERRLAEYGLLMPVDPGADATLGGMAATNAAGTTTLRYGKMRAQILGLTAVLPGGQIIKTGSRATKTSAGYDLTGLLVGSEGTLAVITEITLRLFPIPESIVLVRASFPDVGAACASATAVVAAGLCASRAELVDAWEVRAANHWAGAALPETPLLFVELSGSEAAVDTDCAYVDEIFLSNGAFEHVVERDPTVRNKLWKLRHELFFAEKAWRPGCEVLSTDVCVPLEELAGALEATRAAIDGAGLDGGISAHAGDGNIHAALLLDPTDEDELARVHDLVDRLVDDALLRGGTCSGEHGIGLGKISALVREHGDQLNLMAAIKGAFDPHNIMNPGKVLPESAAAERAKLSTVP